MGNRHGKPQQKPYGKPRSGVCFVHEWFSFVPSYLVANNMEQGSEELGPATPLLSGYDTTHAPPNTPARGAPEPPIGLAHYHCMYAA